MFGPAATHQEILLRRSGLVLLALIFMLSGLALVLEPARWIVERAWVLFLPGVPLYVLALVLTEQRAKRIILQTQSMICPKCRYLLVGLGNEGVCPECARPYDANSLKDYWEKAYWEQATLEGINNPNCDHGHSSRSDPVHANDKNNSPRHEDGG